MFNFLLLIIMAYTMFAERAGFEPAIRFRRIHAFQACLFNHSSISPDSSASLKRAQNTKKIAHANVSVHKSILFA